MYTDSYIKNRWNLLIDRVNNGTGNAYRDAKICEEWCDYNNFKNWFLQNAYASKQFKLELDKDLFGNGEKLYSPETCCLLPKSLNILLASCKSRNEYLPGVSKTKNGKFVISVVRNTTRVRKVFDTELEAFQEYKKLKKENIVIAAEAYKFLLPERIYKALLEYTF